MKRWLIALSLISFNALALENLDLMSICQGKGDPEKAPETTPAEVKPESESSTAVKLVNVDNKDVMIVDNGFCDEYLKVESVALATQISSGPVLSGEICEPTPALALNQQDKWKIRFYASHSFTTYFNSDVSFRSSRYNIDVKDYIWAERSSREFFSKSTWSKPGNNIFQMIDEPTNTFTVSIEKDGHEFFLSAFHPKFLQARNQVRYVKGTVDGTPVDGYMDLNKPFDGYNQEPGEIEIVRNENTHRQMTFELGYGHRFNLAQGKLGSLVYTPSIGLGVMAGNNYSVAIKQGEWWEFEDNLDKFGIQGFGGSVTNRIEFNTPKERFGVFYENKLALYHQKTGFLDGTQEYNLGFMGNSVGMKFMIYNPKNHKKRNPALE